MPPNKTLEYYLAVHRASLDVLMTSLTDASKISSIHSHQIGTIAAWCEVLRGRPEGNVLQNAAHEFSFGLYALVTGSYRHAFSSLRLTLEQSLLAIYLSVNRLELSEWINGNYDTNWASLTGDTGVFSPRYVKSFFPGLEEPAKTYLLSAKLTYRLLSEFVHGNYSSWNLTPKTIVYEEGLQDRWLTSAITVVELINFALTLRFTKELEASKLSALTDVVMSDLGNIELIRVAYGGVKNSI